jgi:pimeloyl-ACP methyl ester carboxylesterase
MTQQRSEFLELDGCRLHLYRGGEGEPVLFLHGASGGGFWLPFMAELARDHDVIAPDHPGFWQSSDPEWLDSVGNLSFFYLDLLRKLNVGPVHVVGSSLGGWIAAEMAVRNTNLIKSLTLVCAVGICVDGKPIENTSGISPQEHLRRFCHDETSMLARQRQLESVEPELRARNRATVMRLCGQPWFHNPKLPNWLHRIDRGTLILWGASDEIVPLPFGHEWNRLIPSSRLTALPRSGHAPFVEQPDEFNDELRKFWRQRQDC